MKMASELYKLVFDANVERILKETLNETPQVRVQALKEIKEWLKDHSNLNAKQDDEDILPFLRVCKFDVEKTKIKITKYYEFRRDIPEWFSNRHLDLESGTVRDLVKSGVFLPLKRTFEKKLVFIMRATQFDPKIYRMNDITKTSAMVLDAVGYRNEALQIYGGVILVDMAGTTFEHAKQFSITFLKNTVTVLQNYYYRPQLVVFLNMPVFLGVLANLFVTFMPRKLKSRVRFYYNGMGNLHEIFDVDILPPEYGGNGESVDELQKFWFDRILKASDWFAEDEKHKAD